MRKPAWNSGRAPEISEVQDREFCWITDRKWDLSVAVGLWVRKYWGYDWESAPMAWAKANSPEPFKLPDEQGAERLTVLCQFIPDQTGGHLIDGNGTTWRPGTPPAKGEHG